MAYYYSEAAKVLDAEDPLVTRDALLTVCKEIDSDTPEGETTAFVGDAHVLVCNVLDGYGIPLDLLTLIEKQLAAHFAALTYPSVQRTTFMGMGETLAVKTGEGLGATRYGHTALSLDPTGMLKRFSDGKGQRSVIMRSVGSGLLPQT